MRYLSTAGWIGSYFGGVSDCREEGSLELSRFDKATMLLEATPEVRLPRDGNAVEEGIAEVVVATGFKNRVGLAGSSGSRRDDVTVIPPL